MNGLRITEQAWVNFVKKEIGRHPTNVEYSKYFDGQWSSADALVAEVKEAEAHALNQG